MSVYCSKSSLSLYITNFSTLVQMSTRKGSTDVHEFDGMFQGSQAFFRVTSVIGHVLRLCISSSSVLSRAFVMITSLDVLVLVHVNCELRNVSQILYTHLLYISVDM